MNAKLKVSTIVRALLTAVGSFLIGRVISGVTIDAPILVAATGAVLTAISTVWGIVDKTLVIEKLQSGLRQVFVFAGGFLISRGWITSENLEAILGLLSVVATVVYSQTSREKSIKVATDQISTTELKK